NLTTIAGTTLTGDPSTTGTNGVLFNGLELSQEWTIFALDPDTPIMRGLFIVTNPTAAPITQELGIFNNVGSDSNTTTYTTPTLTPRSHTWIRSFQNFTRTDTTTTDPRLLFVIQGPGSVATPANSHSTYANGDDNPNFFYSLTVQPGETQILMLYSGLFASRA